MDDVCAGRSVGGAGAGYWGQGNDYGGVEGDGDTRQGGGEVGDPLFGYFTGGGVPVQAVVGYIGGEFAQTLRGRCGAEGDWGVCCREIGGTGAAPDGDDECSG